MTSKEVKVYLSKQIMVCEEKIELYENVKASKDFIELHKNLLDFYKTIEKDLEVLEILKPNLKLQNIGTTPKYEVVLVMDENMVGFDKIKELLEQ